MRPTAKINEVRNIIDAIKQLYKIYEKQDIPFEDVLFEKLNNADKLCKEASIEIGNMAWDLANKI
jgi:hypothetical protein